MPSRHRTFALCFCLAVLGAIALQRPRIHVRSSSAPQRGTVISFCASDLGQPVVYFSEIFDTGIRIPAVLDSRPMGNEFDEYLVGRFDFKRNENFPAACPGFDNVAQAQVNKRKLNEQMFRSNKEVVEVNWNYPPNDEEVALAAKRDPHNATAQFRPKPTHTWCLSETYLGVIYSTGPFNTDQNWAEWYRGFNNFLTQKYSFKGRFECKVTTLADAQRLMNARSEGARAAGRKIVDTGWKYDPATAAAPKQAPRDDDPEPTPKRPAPPSPTQQTRDAAVKEIPESKAYCQKDPMTPIVFNCNLFARSVYNYRTSNPTDTSSIATLMASEKLNAADAIDSTHVSIWVSQRGNAQKLDNKVINCVSQNVIVTLYKKPWPNQLQQFYKDALATCSKTP